MQTVSTVVFLTILLIKGEIKASKSNKGFGTQDVHSSTDKTPFVSVISHENEAFNHDVSKDQRNDAGKSDANKYEDTEVRATPISDSICHTDIPLYEKSSLSSEKCDTISTDRGRENGEPYMDTDAGAGSTHEYSISKISDYSYENPVIESSRL